MTDEQKYNRAILFEGIQAKEKKILKDLHNKLISHSMDRSSSQLKKLEKEFKKDVADCFMLNSYFISLIEVCVLYLKYFETIEHFETCMDLQILIGYYLQDWKYFSDLYFPDELQNHTEKEMKDIIELIR